ncbi:MAG TPA: glycosyltransferase [Bacillota bacterium]|jgi:GT2 family glycosyltransferase
MKTSIVVVTNNQLPFTRLCLESIGAYTLEPYELIVVDNGSNDGTREFLAAEAEAALAGGGGFPPEVKVILNDLNEGYPKACNQGLRAATGEAVVLLNNDMVVTPRWLTNLLNCLEATGAGAVGPASNMISGLQRVDAAYDSLESMERFAETFNRPDETKWRPTVRLGGGGLLLRREVLGRVGYFDESFTPGNFEDDDFSLRVVQAGFGLRIAGDTFIHHFGGVTLGRGQAYAEVLGRNAKYFCGKWATDDATVAYLRQPIADAVPAGARQVLDLRCGAGALGLELKRRGVGRVCGIEAGPALASVAARSLDQVAVGDPAAVSLPYVPESFDVVVADGVFERAADPWRLLARVDGWLATDGVLVATVSNVAHLSTIAGLLQGTWRYSSPLPRRGHLRFFTKKTFVETLTEAGFEAVGVSETLGDLDDRAEVLLLALDELSRRHGLSGGNVARQGRVLSFMVTARKKQ